MGGRHGKVIAKDDVVGIEGDRFVKKRKKCIPDCHWKTEAL